MERKNIKKLMSMFCIIEEIDFKYNMEYTFSFIKLLYIIQYVLTIFLLYYKILMLNK